MNPPRPRSQTAFSLVEVTLSLGIIGFALVAVLGLMGVGINASRDNADDTVMGLIMQDLGARVRSELSSVGQPVDASGQALTTGNSDFRWNGGYSTRPGFLIVGNPGVSGNPKPDPSSDGANCYAYYSKEGVFVREAVPGAYKDNYYKAAIYVRPLPQTGTPPVVSYASLNLPVPTPAPTATTQNLDYPLLAVTVTVGWPADNSKADGVIQSVKADIAKTTFTFFLSRP